jgi:hypothetical protein
MIKMINQTHGKPDPDFESFALDCIQLARQEKSLQLRSRLLILAREWMHAAMQEPGETGPRRNNAMKRRESSSRKTR